MPNHHQPIHLQQRAHLLDILRGFALLGICLANAGYFSMYIFQSPAQQALMPASTLNRWLMAFHEMFIEGKFYSIFSFLFGIGFAIIFFHKAKPGSHQLLLFYRRLFVLMLLGLAHILLVWDGDILFFYAITGALLPLFRHCSNRTLVSLAILLLLCPILADVLKVASDGKWNISRPFEAMARKMDQRSGINDNNISNWLVTHRQYSDLMHWSQSGFWWSLTYRLDSNRIYKVLAMFLLGLAVGRTRLYEQLAAWQQPLRAIRKWCLLIALPAGAAMAYFNADGIHLPAAGGLADSISYALNVAPLSIVYIITLAFWYQQQPQRLAWLQPVGQMALTNYIMQSIFGIAIYYGIGFGLGARYGPSVYMPIAVAIFAVQVLYSHWWMRRFQYGPLEWIWRQLTYGKRLPIRR